MGTGQPLLPSSAHLGDNMGWILMNFLACITATK